MNTPDWIAYDHDHAWHPYTQMKTAPTPIPIESAKGAHLHTSDGRKLIDGISSWWVTLHGHGEPRLVEAIHQQAQKLDHVIYAGFTHEPASRLAHDLCQVLPGNLTKVFYSDNGSTAVEVGLKMAFQHWFNRGEKQRTRFITIEDAYHGDTVGTMAPGGTEVFHKTFKPLLFEVDRIPHPHSQRWDPQLSLEERSDACLDVLEELLEHQADTTAAFLIEPLIQGAGGMLIWPPSSLTRMRKICDRYGILLVLDEVFTGFGRTGSLFAYEQGDIVPDIICLSKAITGGMLPLAATVTHEEIYSSFLSDDRGKTFFHGHSYTANPIACNVGVESLKLLLESGVERIEAISSIHSKRMAKLASHPLVSNPGHLGLISRMEISESKDSTEASNYLSAIGPRLAEAFLKRNILLRPLGNVLYMMPPLAIRDEELHSMYDALDDILEELS